MPCRRTCRVTTWPSGADSAEPDSTPIIEMVPPGRMARSDCGSVFSPPSSTMWSKPRPEVISREAFDHSGVAV